MSEGRSTGVRSLRHERCNSSRNTEAYANLQGRKLLGREERGGAGCVGATSPAHVLGTAGDGANRISGPAPLLHSRTTGAVSVYPQKCQATGP